MLSILSLGVAVQTFSDPALAEESEVPLKKHISKPSRGSQRD